VLIALQFVLYKPKDNKQDLDYGGNVNGKPKEGNFSGNHRKHQPDSLLLSISQKTERKLELFCLDKL
jgi:hypothetical protein